MKRIASIIVAAALAAGASAGTSEMVRSTIAAGGGASQGATFQLTGVVGQWQAHASAAGPTLSLTGGFWGPGETASCPADLDGSGAVGSGDLASLLGQWGAPGPADIDGSGTVGSGDLASLLGAWGPCP